MMSIECTFFLHHAAALFLNDLRCMQFVVRGAFKSVAAINRYNEKIIENVTFQSNLIDLLAGAGCEGTKESESV